MWALKEVDFVFTILKTAYGGLKKERAQPALTLVRKDNKTVIEYSWIEYIENAQAVANVLIKFKIVDPTQENFVAIIGLNRPETFFVLLGVIMAGGIPVPINVPLLKEADHGELKNILDDCKPAKVLANEELTPHLPDIPHLTFEQVLTWAGCLADRENGSIKWKPPPVMQSPPAHYWHHPNKLLIMPYTSGTTGKSKGVMLSHENILSRTTAVTEALETTADDRILSYLSLGHISDLVASFFGQAESGYSVYFTAYAYELVFDREKFRPHFPALLQKVRPTIFLAVPKVWSNLQKEIEKKIPRFIPHLLLQNKVKKGLGLNKTKHFISAGAKISPKQVAFFKSLRIPIRDIYGQTETSGPILLDGQEIGQIEVTVDLVTDEILVHGPSVMQGYYNNAQATEKVLVFTPDWYPIFKTGDLGTYDWLSHPTDPQPRIIIKGRLDDGCKLGQAEYVTVEVIGTLEQRLSDIDGVEEAIVCGDGDNFSKNYLVAIIFSKKSDLSSQEHHALYARILEALPEIGKGLRRVKNFAILGGEHLMITATSKARRKAIIKKYSDLIEKL